MGLLDGKVALVTGGTSGIGRASALLFARQGAKIALTGRRKAEGESVVAEIHRAGGHAIFIPVDLAKTSGISGLVTEVVSRYGRLDCAFNNAGVSGGGPIETLDEKTWDSVIDTNLKSAFFCLKAQVIQMKAQGTGGSIVFTASALANIGAVGTSIYSASKGGVVAIDTDDCPSRHEGRGRQARASVWRWYTARSLGRSRGDGAGGCISPFRPFVVYQWPGHRGGRRSDRGVADARLDPTD